MMLKAFNAFQIVVGFSITPPILSWLRGQEFSGSGPLFWLGCLAYAVYFLMVCACVLSAIEELK